MSKVYVIVPIYGVEQFLEEALDSILNQTLNDLEIILIDDGSKDNCPQIIDEYVQKDSRIIAIHKENGGYGAACNLGLEKASGEYIAIFEPDDYIDPKMYEDLYNIAQANNSDIVKEYNNGSKVVFHCFSGSVEFMRECVKQGWYIALGGVITFKNAVKMKEVAKEVPLEKLVLETDSPYLTPVPFRGKENKPGYVRYVAEEIAKIRGMSIEEIIDITTRNAEEIFKIWKKKD